MTNAQHTPGPWKAYGTLVSLPVTPDETQDVNICDMHRSNLPDAECCANARLIAAAPELLEALELIIGDQPYAATQEWRDQVKKAREMAKAAVAKARGQA